MDALTTTLPTRNSVTSCSSTSLPASDISGVQAQCLDNMCTDVGAAVMQHKDAEASTTAVGETFLSYVHAWPDSLTESRDPVGEGKVSIAIQANDYDIERRSGKLPARKRVIPKKFWDYRDPDRYECEDNSDEDYDPEEEAKKLMKTGKRGRPRKIFDHGQDITQQSSLGDVAPSTVSGTPHSRAPKLKPAGCQNLKRGRPSKSSGILLDKIYPCEVCKKKFSQKGNLKAHMLIHSNERPYKCDIAGCTKAYRSNNMLKVHKAGHFGIKMYECPECNQKLATSVSLKEHLLIHQNLRPHPCGVCGKKFRQLSALTKHLVTHSSDTPFSCDTCGRMFSQQSYLKSHQKVHTGEKPFVCTICNKAFAHGSDLVRHKTVHTREKPYTCDTCGARFSDPSSRRRHMKEHVGVKPYSCQLCEDNFKRAGQLKAHLYRKHTSLGDDVRFAKGGNALQFTFKGGSHIVTLRDALTQAPVHVGEKALELQKKISLELQKPGQVYQLMQADKVTGDQQSVVNTMLQLSQTPGYADQSKFVTTGIEEQSTNRDGVQQVFEETSGDNSAEEVNNVEESMEMGIPEEVASAVVAEASDQSGTRMDPSVEIEYHIIEYDEGGTVITSHDIASHVGKQNGYNEDSVSAEQTVQGNATAIRPQDTAPPGVDYITNPDFASQGYYNWLSHFTELCKLVPMPLDVDLFTKISQVQKSLADILASPTGVLTKRENFQILMGISRDLNTIANEHLTYILQNLDNAATADL